ncbi:MAG: TonB family protein [Xanthobacteraceae bacterium]|nr:TonB family protein [Xanthobacteraceae bacterium]
MTGRGVAVPASALAPTPPRGLWVLAAAAAVALHVGVVVLALVGLSPGDTDEDAGAPGIEIGIELAAPQGEVLDLPVGPDSEASAASAAQAEQKPVQEEPDLPKEVPHEAAEPDRMVSATAVEKPEDSDPKAPPVATAAAREAAASEATAMPTSQTAKQSDRAVTTAQGVGEAKARARATYGGGLSALLKRHLRYPPDRLGKAARVVVTFAIDRGGHLLSSAVVKGSGDAAFDAAALAMLKRADPLPPPPAEIADDGLTFTAPVDFNVKDRK